MKGLRVNNKRFLNFKFKIDHSLEEKVTEIVNNYINLYLT